MPLRAKLQRPATYADIEERLRDAVDHLGNAIRHENEAGKASAPDSDPKDLAEAERLFRREFRAYLTAVRAVRNYFVVAANTAKNKSWLEARLVSPDFEALAEFHLALSNQDHHNYLVTLEAHHKVIHWTAEPGAVRLRSGLWSRMKVTGFADAIYAYKVESLEPPTATLHAAVLQKYPGESALQVALRYVDGLDQILKNARRNRRFG